MQLQALIPNSHTMTQVDAQFGITKICCSENLTVDEIKYMWHTNVGWQNQIPLHTQTAVQ